MYTLLRINVKTSHHAMDSSTFLLSRLWISSWFALRDLANVDRHTTANRKHAYISLKFSFLSPMVPSISDLNN